MNRKNWEKLAVVFSLCLGTVFFGMKLIANRKKQDSVYGMDKGQQNPMAGKKVIFIKDENDKENADGVKGHLMAVGDSVGKDDVYDRYLKRVLDIMLSFLGLVILAPFYLGISLAIKIDDPGPVLFTQKRVGKNKEYFKLHKFRSMKMSTPHDMPTHMLENPEQYITKVGRILRKYSLDELPQIWDIFIGNMSIIGPRPALWNQDLLVAERDKYGANDVRPGLTGWAQINGRDELEIPVKANLDGIYVEKESFLFDARCFIGTITSVLKHEGVVEGGTGTLTAANDPRKAYRDYTKGKSEKELIGTIGFCVPVTVDHTAHKNILITGADSYVGDSFTAYAKEHYSKNFSIDVIDMRDEAWRKCDFSIYDIVYHVAGIAHADVGNVSDEIKEKYYKVNTDLAIEVAQKAKDEGAKEFIFMSSMIIYGDSAPYGQKKVITAQTVPVPANFYGDSKLQADVAVRELADEKFKVIVLRPPMIYGKGSKGNYPVLAKLARKLPVFPKIENERSMLYIENLCEFLCQVMLIENPNQSVVLIPQNKEWTNTCQMVKEIAEVSGQMIKESKFFNPAVYIGSKIPGKIGGLVNKAFGNSCYVHEISEYPGINYQINSLRESVKIAENIHGTDDKDGDKVKENKKHILVVSQYFYPEQFRINDMCMEWVKRGHKVTVVTGIPNYPMGKIYEGYGLTKKRHEVWNGVEIYRIPLIPRGTSKIGMVANYASFMLSGIIAGLTKKIKADLVFSFEVSPMTQVLTGVAFSKRLQVPHYLYVQDLWPENVITVTGISNPAIIKPIDKMVDYIYKNTDYIFATSPSFVETICNRKIKVPKEKVHYWPQYAEDFYKPIDKSVAKKKAESYGIKDNGTFKIIFTGNVGTAQGLDILPKTAALLKYENVEFVIVGDGRYLDEFNNEIKRNHVQDKFVMIPRQPAENIPMFLCACDAAFISFQKDELWAKTIPAKLQSYMACGMPVIASAEGETKRIIEEAGCGVCCSIGAANELSETIKMLKKNNLSEMSINSIQYCGCHFQKETLMNVMKTLMENNVLEGFT